MATLEITVKTLDSQNHKFDVGDELTVKQFKEKIAETVSVSAEAQRLIYCGRVLQDDKKLSEYGLDKKVVHLVQKLPPSQRPPSTAGGTSSTRSAAGGSGARRGGGGGGGHPRDGSMYLGALAFPSDIFSVQGTQEMIQSAAQSRLSIVHNMLQSAQNCVTSLEDPNASPAAPPAPPPSASTATETDNDPFRVLDRLLVRNDDIEGTFTTSVPLMGNMPQAHDAADAMAGAVSAAVAGALSAIVSAVGNTMGTSNITIVQQGAPLTSHNQPPPSTHQGEGRNMGGSNQPSGATNSAPETSGSSPPGQANRASPPSDNNGGSPQRRQGAVRTSLMADSLDEVMAIQDRLRPFLQRTSQLLRDDPPLPAASPELEEAQRVFNLVSETLHLLSHAYHGLSDLSVGLTRPPPRSVGVRSLVLQPTAVLQAGIPIQAQINVMTNRVSPTSANSASSSPTPQSTGQNPAPPPTTQQPASSQPSAPPSGTTAGTQGERRRHFNLSSGGDLELIMEVGPGGITLEHASATPASSSEPTGRATRVGAGAGVPPPELLQNIIQAMAAQMVGVSRDGRVQTGFAMPMSQNMGPQSASGAANAASTGASTSAPSGSAGAPGQNSTARGNTATHPTTSTQTRSTARPHVHLAPVNWPGPQNFDPFLPCNSHHIQPLLRLQRPQQTQTPSAGQATRTQASNQQSRPAAGAVPRNATFNIAQQIFGEAFGPGFMNTQSTLTVADFLSSMPDYTYTQGESFFTDLFVTMARHFTFRDLVQVSMRQSAPLNRLRLPLRHFINEQLLHGDSPSSESISRSVDRVLHEIQPYLEVVRASQLREDINFEASIRRFCQARLPELIHLVMNDDTMQFGTQLMRMSGQFVRDLASLTLMCCHGGRQGLERILHRYVQVLTGDLEQSIQQWTSANSRLPLRSFVQSLGTPSTALDEFLVRVQPATTEALPASAPPQTTATNVESTPGTQQDVEEAMECDGDEFVLAMEEPNVPVIIPPSAADVKREEEDAAAVLPPMQMEQEACDVVVGSEEWHTGIDPDWVPVISRDIQRQRRQSDQPPFSDAYLAGMSSKRRKLIANSKPQGTVSQVIAETVAQAAGAAGVPGADQLAQAAGSDPTIQAAYKEEVKRSVSQQLASNPDFSADRFPNANKYFNPSPK